MICIGCGCDELHACTLPGGTPCAWIHAGAQGLAGICTACIELFPPSIIEHSLTTCEAAIAEFPESGDDIPAMLHPGDIGRPRLILPGDPEFHL